MLQVCQELHLKFNNWEKNLFSFQLDQGAIQQLQMIQQLLKNHVPSDQVWQLSTLKWVMGQVHNLGLRFSKLYNSGDPKTGYVQISNGRPCPDFKWCPVFKWSGPFENRTFGQPRLFYIYSGDLNTQHSNTGNIWIPNILKVRFLMVLDKMAAILVQNHSKTGLKCPVFKWWV